MRTIIGAIAMVMALAAQPAFAGEGAAPAGATAPLLTTTTAAVPLAIAAAPLATMASTSLLAAPGATPDAGFRLAPLTSASVQPKSPIVTTDLTRGLHRRFTGTMVEYYPVEGFGFHLSGGSRLFQRRNFVAETEDSARGALAVRRVTSSSAVTRAGFKRFNPVATAGYTVPLSPMAQVGVEAGAMMTSAFASTPGLPRRGASYRSDAAFHPDAIANLVFGMHF